MSEAFKIFVLISVSYLIGSISPSYLIGKYVYKIDIRKKGSGNAGTTNALRIMGKKAAAYTFLIDFLKGLFCAYLGKTFVSAEFSIITGFFSVLGHDFPFYMNFKGGKGVATSIGATVFFLGKYLIFIFLISIFIIYITKTVSLGSLTAFFLTLIACVVMLFLGKIKFDIYVLFLIMLCVLTILKHKSNIQRILAGRENKL